MQTKVVNVRKIFNSEIELNSSGFVLKFLADTTDPHVRREYRLHFDGLWWAGAIVGELWKVVKVARRNLVALEESMKEG